MSLDGTKTHENLKAAFAGESQANRRYLYFARAADIEGYPESGFQMENSINRLDALTAMTSWGAYANFEEDEKGTIEVGKDADFIILDNDLLTSDENRIPLTNIVATFINGELVFNRRFN